MKNFEGNKQLFVNYALTISRDSLPVLVRRQAIDGVHLGRGAAGSVGHVLRAVRLRFVLRRFVPVEAASTA